MGGVSLSTGGIFLEPAVATIFFESAKSVFHAEFGETPTTIYGNARTQPFTSNDLVIEIEISGDLSGRACYGFSAEVIATLGGMPDPERGFDAYSESLVQEMANIITGQTLIKLENHGHRCEISPPEILEAYQYPVPEEVDDGEAVQFLYQGGHASIWTDLKIGDQTPGDGEVGAGFDQSAIDALFAAAAS